MFIVRMSYVELYNNRFRNLLEGGPGAGGDGKGPKSRDPGEAVGFGSSVGSGRGSWREAPDEEVSSVVFVMSCILFGLESTSCGTSKRYLFC